MNVSEEKNLVERNIMEIVQLSVKFTIFCIKKKIKFVFMWFYSKKKKILFIKLDEYRIKAWFVKHELLKKSISIICFRFCEMK